METRQILIKIITEIGNRGIIEARKAVNETANSFSGLKGRLQGVISTFRNFDAGVANVRAGLQRLRQSVLGTGSGFNIFNNLFSRITGAMLIWSAWRNVAQGFRAIADAVVGGNARMQAAEATFTALSGGSEELGKSFVNVTRNLSLQFGANVDEMLSNAKRLPTQVGANFQAFEKLIKTSLVLGVLDPVQGAEGAMIALTNALEGTAQGFRSLVQRFEISSFARVRQVLSETSDPFEALNRVIEEAGINVDQFLATGLNTLGVAFKGIVNIVKEFFRLIGENPLAELTKDVVVLRDFLVDLVESGAFEGLARAVGDELAAIFKQIRAFLSEIFLGGEELSPESIFEGIVVAAEKVVIFLTEAVAVVLDLVSLIANAINSIFSLFGGGGTPAQDFGFELAMAGAQETEKVVNRLGDTIEQAAKKGKEAVQEVAQETEAVITKSGAGIAPVLAQIRDGGKRTIEEYVNGLIDGVSAADLEKISEELIQNVINLEAQVQAQEDSVDNIKKWVDEAAREVQQARDRIKLFDLATADIPERFTRARRRQLELEALRAEQEQRRRQEVLKIAQEQLKATKDNLKTQEKILSLVERQLKAQEKAEQASERRGQIDRSFKPPTIDLAAQERRIEEFRAKFAERLAPTFDRIRGSLGNLADSIRNFRDSVGQAGSNIGGLGKTIDNFFASLGLGWEKLNPNLRFLILGLLGIKALKLLAGFAIPVSISATLKGAIGFLKFLFGPAAATLAATGTFPLTIAVAILIAEFTFAEQLFGVAAGPELLKWLTGQRAIEIFNIIKLSLDPKTRDLVFGEINKGIDEIQDRVFRLFDTLSAGTLSKLGAVAPSTLENIEIPLTPFAAIGNISNITSGIQKLLSGSGSDMEQAAKQGVTNPIQGVFQSLFDAVVGNSIMPDMMTRIVGLFTLLPNQLQTPLAELQETILTTMQNIKLGWLTNITEMMTATTQLIQLQNQLAQVSLANLSNINTNLNVSVSGNQRLALSLNANETRRLMREGTYQALIDVGGRS